MKLRSAGFTLLELLVVLTLISLLVSMVALAASTAIENADRRGIIADVQAALASLPISAFQRGKALRLEDASLAAGLDLEMPAGTQIHLAAPLIYAENGMASGGQVLLTFRDGETVSYDIRPVTGEVARRNPASP